MKSVCAWCKKVMGEVEPLDSDAETHGICPDCTKKYFSELKDIKPMKNPRKRSPEWYQNSDGTYTLAFDGSIYFIRPDLGEYKLSYVVGDKVQYIRAYPTVAAAMKAVDHGQGRRIKRPMKNPRRKTPLLPGARHFVMPEPVTHIATSQSSGTKYYLAADGNVYAPTGDGRTFSYGTLAYFKQHANEGHWNLIFHRNPGAAYHEHEAEQEEQAETTSRRKGKTVSAAFHRGKATAHRQSELKARSMGLNPGSRISANVEGIVYNRIVEIKAEKTLPHNAQGFWRHPFSKKSNAQILALDNGDLLIHSTAGKRLWKPF